MLPQFQYILDKIGENGKFGGWLRARMKLGEPQVIILGQDEEIFKHYLFFNNMWTHKGKHRLVPKYEGYGVMILVFQYQVFSFRYTFTVPDLQTVNEYCALHPKYVHVYTETTILRKTRKEPITMWRNYFCKKFE